MEKKTVSNGKKIKNLVIGSEGFLGMSLCSYLENKGEHVTHFDIKRSNKEDGRVAKFKLDAFDRIYFLAWEVGGAKYLYRKDTQLFQLNWNIDLLRNVMFQLQKTRTPFVFISSQLADETDTVYGAIKKIGELWTQQLGGVCVRLWNIYGTREESSEKSHVISDFIHQAIETGEIRMITNGEEKRQFTHIEDVCDALHYLMEKKLNDKVYDLTNFEWISIKEVADIIGKHTGAKIIPGVSKGTGRDFATMKGKPHGWLPKVSIEEGIKKMISLLKKNNKKAK